MATRTALEDDVIELRILWPHLAYALERDAGQWEGERVSGESSALGLPVNADVLQARTAMETEIPAWAYWAASVVAEPHVAARDILLQLYHLPRLHERMLVTAAHAEAARLVSGLHAILQRVRSALGLRAPDRCLREWCPLHDEPLTELVVPGQEGVLTYSRIDRAGQPVDPRVEWLRQPGALCRHCKASWDTDRWLLLGRMLRDAKRRREASQRATEASVASAGSAA